jgi:flagellar basal body-associated protein FliL
MSKEYQKMRHKKIITLMLGIVLITIIAGAILNTIVVSSNGGMPTIGYTASVDRWVPINETTKFSSLSDIIRIGHYVLSLGDVFIVIGAAICPIALWVALPKGRKMLPLFIMNIIGVIASRAIPYNILPTVLFTVAAVGCVLVMYSKERAEAV